MADTQKANDRYTVQRVADAITEGRGIKAAAARLLGCDYHTVDSYIKRYVTCREAYKEATSQVTDVARSNVVQSILDGDLDNSKWWLVRKDPEFGAVTNLTVEQGQDAEGLQVQRIKVVFEDD